MKSVLRLFSEILLFGVALWTLFYAYLFLFARDYIWQNSIKRQREQGTLTTWSPKRTEEWDWLIAIQGVMVLVVGVGMLVFVIVLASGAFP